MWHSEWSGRCASFPKWSIEHQTIGPYTLYGPGSALVQFQLSFWNAETWGSIQARLVLQTWRQQTSGQGGQNRWVIFPVTAPHFLQLPVSDHVQYRELQLFFLLMLWWSYSQRGSILIKANKTRVGEHQGWADCGRFRQALQWSITGICDLLKLKHIWFLK